MHAFTSGLAVTLGGFALALGACLPVDDLAVKAPADKIASSQSCSMHKLLKIGVQRGSIVRRGPIVASEQIRPEQASTGDLVRELECHAGEEVTACERRALATLVAAGAAAERDFIVQHEKLPAGAECLFDRRGITIAHPVVNRAECTAYLSTTLKEPDNANGRVRWWADNWRIRVMRKTVSSESAPMARAPRIAVIWAPPDVVKPAAEQLGILKEELSDQNMTLIKADPKGTLVRAEIQCSIAKAHHNTTVSRR